MSPSARSRRKVTLLFVERDDARFGDSFNPERMKAARPSDSLPPLARLVSRRVLDGAEFGNQVLNNVEHATALTV